MRVLDGTAHLLESRQEVLNLLDSVHASKGEHQGKLRRLYSSISGRCLPIELSHSYRNLIRSASRPVPIHRGQQADLSGQALTETVTDNKRAELILDTIAQPRFGIGGPCNPARKAVRAGDEGAKRKRGSKGHVAVGTFNTQDRRLNWISAINKV